MKRKLTKIHFTLIELILVMILSAFMVISAAMFATPLTEMFLMVNKNTVKVIRVRKAMSRLIKELNKSEISSNITTTVTSDVTINRDGDAFRFYLDETSKQFWLSKNGEVGLLVNNLESFAVKKVIKNSGSGQPFSVIEVILDVIIGDETISLKANVHKKEEE